MRRLAVLIAALGLLGSIWAAPALAADHDPTIGGQATGQGVGLDGTQESSGSTGAQPVGTSSQPPTRAVACTSAGAAPGCAAAIASCTKPPLPAPPNIAIIEQQQPDGSWRQTTITCNSRTGLGDTLAVITAAMVRQQVVRLLPPVAVGIAPADGPTLVNMETVFWAPTPETRQLGPVTILGQQVAITIRFDHATYDYGDGTTATLDHPGTPWTENACTTAQCPGLDGHTYTTPADALTTRSTITWTATYTVAGGTAQPIPGTIDGPTATHTLQVLEGRAVIVR